MALRTRRDGDARGGLLVVAVGGGNLSLLPLGLGLLALISLPMAAAGLAGARAHRKSLPPGRE